MKSFDKRPASIFSPIASPAFTIVELLVVIVVIGILATITIVAYTGISNKASEASVIADLSNTNKQFKLFQVENSGYPTTIDCAQPNSSTNKCIKPSSNNTFGIFYSDNTTSPQVFCLTIKGSGAIKKNINQDGVIADGACTYPFPSTLVANAPTRYTINLSWGAITGAQSYVLQRATDNAFTANLTTLTAPSAGATTATSSSLTPGTTYYYRLKVTIDGDESAWSNTASAVTTSFPAPASLAQTGKTTTSISLSWGSVASINNYTLRRSSTADFASYTDATIVSGTTVYTSSGLTQGTYYYRVKANDAGGSSPWSSDLLTNTNYVFNYAYTGSTTTLTIPQGITSINMEVWGGKGGKGGDQTWCTANWDWSYCYGAPWYVYGGAGGSGGYAKGTLTVTSGQTFTVYAGNIGAAGANQDCQENEDPSEGVGCGAAGTNGTAGQESYIKLGATYYLRGYGGTGGVFIGAAGTAGTGWVGTGMTLTGTTTGANAAAGTVKVTF